MDHFTITTESSMDGRVRTGGLHLGILLRDVYRLIGPKYRRYIQIYFVLISGSQSYSSVQDMLDMHTCPLFSYFFPVWLNTITLAHPEGR